MNYQDARKNASIYGICSCATMNIFKGFRVSCSFTKNRLSQTAMYVESSMNRKHHGYETFKLFADD